SNPKVPAPPARSYTDMAIWIGLIVAIFLVYGQAGSFDFNTYDDPLYVSENSHVHSGFTADSLKYAFTAVVANHWVPLTLLSHITAGQLFGMQSGAHHVLNVLLH